MAITKKLIDGLIVTIQNLYLTDDIPWMIGYSGGKDSTAAVQLVWMAIEQLPERYRKKTIYIMNTDTLVESPVVSKWVDKSLKFMKDESEKKGLPFVPIKLIPDYNNTFWVNLIGRGYPFPRKKYRWCTDRLKIQPVNNFIKNKIAEHGEAFRMNLLDDFLTASNLAGIAFGNAGTGAVHAMSYPLSGVYHVTHGEANYQFLTAVFAKYQELDPDGRIKELNSFLSNVLECDADLVYVEIGKLLDQIIARKPLHEYGMREEEIESFAKTVEETQQRLLNQSYVKLTWQQMAEIYKELY